MFFRCFKMFVFLKLFGGILARHGFQDDARSFQNAFKGLQDAFENLKDGSTIVQDAPKSFQGAPKTTPESCLNRIFPAVFQ